MVSVIIPTYNGEKVIERAIQSVLRQGHPVEILICDDGSTDDTIKIATRYPNVKVIPNDKHTGGPNAGRNNGIRAASGKYVAFLDQDDEWLSNKLNYQLQLLERFDVATSGFVRVEKKS